MSGDPRFAKRDTAMDEICFVQHPLWESKPGCRWARCSILKRVEHEIHSWDGLLYWKGPEDDSQEVG